MNRNLAGKHPAFVQLKSLETRFVKPHRGAVAWALAGMLVQSALLLPIPLLQGSVLDRIISLGQEPSAVESRAAIGFVLTALAASLCCYLAKTGLAWWVADLMTRVSLDVVRVLTDAMHRKLQRLPVAYFDREQTGRVMSRITSDVGTLLIFLNSSSLQLVSDLVLAAGIVVVLVWLNWQLALISFIAVPFYAINHRQFACKVRELAHRLRAQVAAIYALLSERVSAVRVVRSFAQEGAEIAELDARIDHHFTLCWAGVRMGALQGALALLITGLGTAAVLICGILLCRRGTLTFGELLAFYALLAQFYNPVARLTQFHGTVAGTLAAVERIAELLDEPETLTDRPDARPILHAQGVLAFRNVSFSYRVGGTRVLDQIDLKVEPGMKVGILGVSGAGKSTLLALAPRLYDLHEGGGAVLFDGLDVRSYRVADLRRAVALVPQQAALFEGTIRSNLTYARPGASVQAVNKALELADLSGMVAGLPLGLETPVGERGFSLSGGQRQRLALARALIAAPSVLLLDDCTSALDAQTEANIQAALDEGMPGRTCLIVSHRVSSVRNADQIIVLDQGRIVEQGTHDQLLVVAGWYAQAFRMQTRHWSEPPSDGWLETAHPTAGSGR